MILLHIPELLEISHIYPIYIYTYIMIPHIPLKYIKHYYIILHPYNNPSVTHWVPGFQRATEVVFPAVEVATRPGSETEPEAEASESSEVSEAATGWRNEWAEHVERCGNVTWSYSHIYIYVSNIWFIWFIWWYECWKDCKAELMYWIV